MRNENDELDQLKKRLIREILASGSKQNEQPEVIDLRDLGCDALKKFIINYQLSKSNKRYRVLLDDYTCFIMVKRAVSLLGGKLLNFGRESTYLFIEYER